MIAEIIAMVIGIVLVFLIYRWIKGSGSNQEASYGGY